MRGLWIRRLAIALGAVLLVLALAAGVLIASFDAERYKLNEALGARPGGAAAPADAASAPRRPEDLLKDRLRRLLR